MNLFAHLLDRLSYEPRRNAKIALIADFFRHTPDPERGFALAAMTGGLVFTQAKSGIIRQLMAERIDPFLFAVSYDYVGDLSETVALLWPQPAFDGSNLPPPTLSEVVETLASAHRSEVPKHLVRWLNALDETGRWALLKLITGQLRIGVSARLAKTAVAALGDVTPNDVEQVWHGLLPPYTELFAWVEGRGPQPISIDPAPFRPPMLAHPLEDTDFTKLDPAEFSAEWKWDGIRIQVSAGTLPDGRRVVRLYSRTGEEISGAFPELADAITFDGAMDGELLIVREDRVQTFNVLQQRLNRKQVSAKLITEFPAHIRVYDMLVDGEVDCRAEPFLARRARLEAALAAHPHERLSISDIIPFQTWEDLAAARAEPSSAGADGDAVEGVMVKRRDSAYLPGRPKGLWYKWKRDPMIVDAVMMYAQRGKRSSFYSDFTFGCWRDSEQGRELVPVGKAYFGFTDEELIELDRYVRKHTIDRHGPVRVVKATEAEGLVLEIAFEGIQRSPRHKSGVAMRFPRISRIRWDKPSRDADEVGALERLLRVQG
jgi:DNA ligase 1